MWDSWRWSYGVLAQFLWDRSESKSASLWGYVHSFHCVIELKGPPPNISRDWDRSRDRSIIGHRNKQGSELCEFVSFSWANSQKFLAAWASFSIAFRLCIYSKELFCKQNIIKRNASKLLPPLRDSGKLNSIFPLNINFLLGMDESLFSPIHISSFIPLIIFSIFAPHPKLNIPIQLQSNWSCIRMDSF